MKNIHALPTPNPSRLYYWGGKLRLGDLTTAPKNLGLSNQNIYITSDKEIKDGDWTLMFDDFGNLFLCDKPQQYLGIEKGHHLNKGLRKIILTTDQDLIKDGIQAIDDEFLEWFVKNPSCEEVEVEPFHGIKTSVAEINAVSGDGSLKWRGRSDLRDYKIIIPKEEPKQETLEEVAEKYSKRSSSDVFQEAHKRDFINGAKLQQEQNKNKYSAEEVYKLTLEALDLGMIIRQDQLNSYSEKSAKELHKEWFKQLENK